MFWSPILEMAIGLVFVYLLVSLICSAVTELIESWFKNRATDLERGIRELLTEPKGAGMMKQLFKHPLICGLFKGEYAPPAKLSASSYLTSTSSPSYIPARNFAGALLDLVLNPRGTSPSSAPGAPATAPNLRQAIENVPNDAVKRALTAFADGAADDIVKVRESIEAWFDSSMDRVSGWYKRRTQWITLALGFIIAVALNVNTPTVAYRLWVDPTLRSTVVAQAESVQRTDSSQKTPGQRLEDSRKTLEGFGLPIGWANMEFKSYSQVNSRDGFLHWVLWPFFGWLFTALAVSFGAPFWFDLLNKFLTFRSTVKPEKQKQ
jgi:hypothetical protein